MEGHRVPLEGGRALRDNAAANGAKTSKVRILSGVTPSLPDCPVAENHGCAWQGHLYLFSPPQRHGGPQWGGWARAKLQPIPVHV